MHESTKTQRLFSPQDEAVLSGKGIDIGCGVDPVRPDARRFDVQDGDANEISHYIQEQFDYVYSSHCLEHMRDPRRVLLEWWGLVRDKGHLVFVVPDEDLYEQGVFPSRFNSDHKATFTLSKTSSWSPVSINVLDLANSLPGGRLIKLVLQDSGYDRRLLRFGTAKPDWLTKKVLRLYQSLKKNFRISCKPLEDFLSYYTTVDQTVHADAVAQILCIVQRISGPEGTTGS